MDVNQILFNSGMVGAFIIFAIVMARLNSSERQHRDEEWRSFIETHNKNMIDFLDREREQRRDIYDQFGSHMDRLTEAVAELTKAVSDHDANAQVRHDRIALAVNKINGGA